MSAFQPAIDAARVAANAAHRIKADGIAAYDVSNSLGITDVMLLASASNERQVLAVAEEIEKDLALQLHRSPRSREGVEEGQWILLDYGDLIVHVMHEDSRDFYRLERLWDDETNSIDLELSDVRE
ncbi:ribosome silencing factor [Bifidobacterium magnum]|uniref:Ribosomal silencing factor RsfS n=1 Tax=Bifidobacterium magnum TaxID=1692 RepID=A0A087B983_9BIFI|nr:ribosome silencing factor [Bifidobacterium magnum]KFI67583.1 Iojap-like protein [Bifidobacterium magnum]